MSRMCTASSLPVFAVWHYVEVYGSPPRLRLQAYAFVPGWYMHREASELICVPTTVVFTYNSNLACGMSAYCTLIWVAVRAYVAVTVFFTFSTTATNGAPHGTGLPPGLHGNGGRTQAETSNILVSMPVFIRGTFE